MDNQEEKLTREQIIASFVDKYHGGALHVAIFDMFDKTDIDHDIELMQEIVTDMVHNYFHGR